MLVALYFIILQFLIITSLATSCNIRRPDNLISDDKIKDLEKAAKESAVASKDTTTVQIIDTSYNFGQVLDGAQVEYNYRFKNTGNFPLVIQSATASCGCTVPEKPIYPIKPGETGFIKVHFNSKGRVGQVHKTITVISNTNPSFPELMLAGEVLEKN